MKKSLQLTGKVDSLTLEGSGVVRVDGKVYFVDGGLPGEVINFEVKRNRRKHGVASLIEIVELAPGNGRIESDCAYFGLCGGCSFRHYEPSLQIESKQQALMDAFERIGKVTPNEIMTPIVGDWLHYRRKARLGIRYVDKKGGALVGFREKNNSFITALDQCLTLSKPISDLLPRLTQLINQLSVNRKLPQIEVAQGDNQLSLVFRHLEPLTLDDEDLIKKFAQDYKIQAYLQPKGLDSIAPLFPEKPETLFYTLDEFNLQFYFEPTDFVQVNSQANAMMISKVLSLLELNESDQLLDLYCGLGNFSLPIAMRCKSVFAVEGEHRLVSKANHNAQINTIDNVEFQTQDLADEKGDFSWLSKSFNKVLLDPARSGAIVMCQQLIRSKPEKIVYVSCNPATLARDADILVNQGGYQLTQAGIVNMFPHTAHIESIAVFEK